MDLASGGSSRRDSLALNRDSPRSCSRASALRLTQASWRGELLWLPCRRKSSTLPHAVNYRYCAVVRKVCSSLATQAFTSRQSRRISSFGSSTATARRGSTVDVALMLRSAPRCSRGRSATHIVSLQECLVRRSVPLYKKIDVNRARGREGSKHEPFKSIHSTAHEHAAAPTSNGGRLCVLLQVVGADHGFGVLLQSPFDRLRLGQLLLPLHVPVSAPGDAEEKT